MVNEANTQSRLKQLMDERGLKQVDILNSSLSYQKKLGIKMSKSHLSQYVNGKSTPDQHKLFLLAKTLDVNEAWLMGYDVPKNRESHTIPALTTTLSLINDTSAKLDESRQKDVLGYTKQQLKEQEEIKQQNVPAEKAPVLSLDGARARKTLKEAKAPPQACIPIKLDGLLTAGYGSRNFDKEATETVYVASAPKCYDLAFRVAGDSMYPSFENDEIVFVQETDCIHNGMIAAVEIDEEAFLKKIYLEENSIRLVSLNDDVDENGDRLYPDIHANGDKEIYIIGKVVN